MMYTSYFKVAPVEGPALAPRLPRLGTKPDKNLLTAKPAAWLVAPVVVRAILLTALLATVAFAGCTDDPAPSAPAAPGTAPPTTPTPTTPGTTTPSAPTEPLPPNEAGCRFATCIKGHVYAPLWDLGRTWTYDVTGDYYATTDYQATIGVFKVNEDHYLLGTNSDAELRNSAGKIDVMTGPVQKDSYGVLEHDEYQDLLGFLKLRDTTWDIKMWDLDFTLAKGDGIDITHAKGTALGFRVEGAAATGDTLVIEYASDVGWLTSLEWHDSAGALRLSYKLTDFATGANVADLKLWETATWAVVRGFGGISPLSAPTRWTVSDPGSLIFLRVVTEAGIGTAEGKVLPPTGSAEEFSHTGGDVEERVVGFQSGDWIVQSVSDRGRTSDPAQSVQMAIWLFHIIERGA